MALDQAITYQINPQADPVIVEQCQESGLMGKELKVYHEFDDGRVCVEVLETEKKVGFMDHHLIPFSA